MHTDPVLFLCDRLCYWLETPLGQTFDQSWINIVGRQSGQHDGRTLRPGALVLYFKKQSDCIFQSNDHDVCCIQMLNFYDFHILDLIKSVYKYS